MNKPRKRTLLLIFIVVLVSARIALPFAIERVVNQGIANNPEVEGGVSDIDLWILSGRVSLEGLSIFKANAAIPAPILSVQSATFSISWKDLFRGHLFGDIEVVKPVLNVVDGKREANTQNGSEIDWRRALTSFYPFEINRVSVTQGELHFRNFVSNPPVDLYIENIEANASNITNELAVEQSRAAQIQLTANTIGNGKITAESQFNLVAEPARASLTASIEELNLVDFNAFTRAYANLDIQQGVLTISSELNFSENNKIADIDGSLKPVASNLDVLRWKQDAEIEHDPGVIIIWEGLVDSVKWLLEVGPQDRLETTIPIKGSVTEPEVGTASAVFELIGNAITGWFTMPGGGGNEENSANQAEDDSTQVKEQD